MVLLFLRNRSLIHLSPLTSPALFDTLMNGNYNINTKTDYYEEKNNKSFRHVFEDVLTEDECSSMRGIIAKEMGMKQVTKHWFGALQIEYQEVETQAMLRSKMLIPSEKSLISILQIK